MPASLAAHPIASCTLPALLIVPLAQRGRAPAVACVRAGQRVQAGERIALAQGEHAAHVHAPAGGTVSAIEARDTASGTTECIVIAVDAVQAPPVSLPPLTPQHPDLAGRVRDAGIVGLGGAAFPTASKLEQARRLLILNGAECEPWLACDDALLREHAGEVVQGGHVLQQACGARRVLLAIEDRRSEALRAVREAVARAGSDIEVVAVPTIYPAGGERQLIELLAGEEVPAGGLPRDIGVIVHNVATAAACWRAVARGDVLRSRIVTVAGPGVAAPGNFEVLLGTPISHLVAQAGGYTGVAARLLAGGPMMGVALPHDDIPVTADTGGVLVLGADDVRDGPVLPCIRCGACADVCPARLLPQQLHFFLRGGDAEAAREHGLPECIECGCCDVACPSNIPLAEQFRLGKADARLRLHERAFADASRERYRARTARLARDAAERARAQAARAPSASAAVQAALERARARKQGDE